MTVKIARKMGVSETELVHVRRGALLHDIGKMGYQTIFSSSPEHLMRKSGKSCVSIQSMPLNCSHLSPFYVQHLISLILSS